MIRASITRRELAAVRVAWDELQSYIEVVGQEGDLDEEEMPQHVLRDAAADLAVLLWRNGEITAQEASQSVHIPTAVGGENTDR